MQSTLTFVTITNIFCNKIRAEEGEGGVIHPDFFLHFFHFKAGPKRVERLAIFFRMCWKTLTKYVDFDILLLSLAKFWSVLNYRS